MIISLGRRRPGDIAEPASVRTDRWVRTVEEQMQQRRILHQNGHEHDLRLQVNLNNYKNFNLLFSFQFLLVTQVANLSGYTLNNLRSIFSSASR